MVTSNRLWLMPFIRKLHVWSGLFMLPWVLLYGVTAFLFNHPSALPDKPLAHFGPEVFEGTPMRDSPTPRQVAQQIVDDLNKNVARSPFRLVDPDTATTNREMIFATISGDDRFVNLGLEASGRGGTYTHRPMAKSPPKAPFHRDSAAVPPNSWKERADQTIPTVVDRLGLPAGEIKVTSTPDVVFTLEHDGQRWKASYNPMTGALSGKRVEAEEPESWRRYLLRLHTAHGYPWTGRTRWLWALIVDLNFIAMTFWAVSGILMWWQLKSIRVTGAVALIAGLIAAALLMIGMTR